MKVLLTRPAFTAAIQAILGAERCSVEAYRVYHATLHAALEGRQKKTSAGWRETTIRVQQAVLRSLRASRRA